MSHVGYTGVQRYYMSSLATHAPRQHTQTHYGGVLLGSVGLLSCSVRGGEWVLLVNFGAGGVGDMAKKKRS